MVQSSKPSIRIDLNEFKLHLHLNSRTQLTLHFDSPSRRFYLSVIALVVHEMKKSGKIKSIPLQEQVDLLVLLNESIGGAAGSSDKENLLHRIYRKWKDALPNLEEAPLFKVLGRKKEEGDGATGKIYSFTDSEKDGWANLFEYMGSNENVRLKFALDRIAVGLNEASILFGDSLNGEAWEQFIGSLKKDGQQNSEPAEETAPSAPARVLSSFSPERKTSWFWRYRWAVLAIVVGIATGAIWKIYLRPASTEIASIDRMNHPLPDSPSIVVLPFVNMNEDPKQEFLCSAITDSIITALFKVPGVFVIGRASTFSYKGKAVKVKQVSEEFGVRYVLEGSVQRSADRIRINAHLTDALTGHHIWAERYDGDLKDIFSLQDEITMKILTATQVKLTAGEEALSVAKFYKGRQGLDCYLKYFEGTDYIRRGNIEDNNAARRIAEDVIAICPESPMGYFLLGSVHHRDYRLGNTKSPRETIEKGLELAQKMLALDDSIAEGHVLLCNLYSIKREHEKAIAAGEQAVSLAPRQAQTNTSYGNSLLYAGRPEEAIPLFQKAIRFCPISSSAVYPPLGNALRDTGRFEEAVSEYMKAIHRSPNNILAHIGLAATYSMMGREKEAQAEGSEVLRINPRYSLTSFAKSLAYKDQSQNDKIVNALRKAGLK